VYRLKEHNITFKINSINKKILMGGLIGILNFRWKRFQIR